MTKSNLKKATRGPGSEFRPSLILTGDELLYLRSVGTFVAVVNYGIGYPGQVTHVASSPTALHPETHPEQNREMVIDWGWYWYRQNQNTYCSFSLELQASMIL